MGLPGHRRTSSDKRRRASHFALKPAPFVVDKSSGLLHLPHRLVPGATEYNGIAVHIKGKDRKLQTILNKTKQRAQAQPPTADTS